MHERKIASLDLFLTRDWIPCREIRFSIDDEPANCYPIHCIICRQFFLPFARTVAIFNYRTSKKSFSEIMFISISGNFSVFAHFYVKKITLGIFILQIFNFKFVKKCTKINIQYYIIDFIIIDFIIL